jgi:hypothetical protein
VAAERVASDVSARDARVVERALEGVGERRVAHRGPERRAAGVAGQREREHVVPPLERRQDELPRAPGVGEAVQADARWA